MSNMLVINSTSLETRVALVEDGVISEFYVERKHDRGIVGNVYMGRVLRILPGMQAAFVDIGLEKAAFLYVADVYNTHQDFSQFEPGELPDTEHTPERSRVRPSKPIEERLYEGQSILVQVAKEPIGTKGARITGHISIPGRYLVYMPTVNHIGISRRIDEEEERERLKEIVEQNRPPSTGFIVRTASESVSSQYLQADMHVLVQLWRDILDHRHRVSSPSLVYKEHDLILRATRDLFTTDLSMLVVDREEDFKRIQEFVQTYMPSVASRVRYYTGQEPVFDAYGIEIEINRALSRKVWLKSGGYIVIDHTEALTSIDVNTGKYVGKKTLEDTIVKINLEAVEEIAYQLRLRSIGGIIIIDLIDMEKPSNREKVYKALMEALKSDKARTNILKISEFGLIEMTRKRVRESVVQYLCEECPYCEGKGYVKSRQTVAYEIMREIRREASARRGKALTVHAHPEVVAVLLYDERDAWRELESRFDKRLHLVSNRGFHVEHFELATDVP